MVDKEIKKMNVIIGWGLAGTQMAWQLFFQNKNFRVFDSGNNHSTRTAAGLVNPIVFKRLTKSWKADVLLPYADDFYTRIEKEMNIVLFSRKSIIRIFSGVEEQNNWSSKHGDDRFEKYLNPAQTIQLDKIDAPYGGGKVNTIGNLNTKLFLDASKAFFISKGIEFINQKMDYYDVNETDQFIFCEGIEIKNNIFFNYLPLKPTQGETLTIKSTEINFEDVVNKNMFVLPLGNNLFKVGATYNWELTEPEITHYGKQELIEKLKRFVDCEYEIVDHEAGIRPTVLDRRPLIGTHPDNKNLHVFNGLGTKGVMIGPYYSEQFFNAIFNNEELDTEVDIKRYQKLKAN